MFLFDTDTITNIFKKKPSEKLLQKLKKVKKNEQFISTITVGEIVYGALKNDNSDFLNFYRKDAENAKKLKLTIKKNKNNFSRP